MSGGSPRELIIGVLNKHPEGLTITAISDLTKLHRHTVTKYVYELRGADLIYEREIGPARLCYIKDGVTKRKEKEVMSRLNNRNMKSEAGQIQVLAVVLFLVLVPAAIITAQNVTNSSVGLEGMAVSLDMEIDTNSSLNESGGIDGGEEGFFGGIENETVNETGEPEGANETENATTPEIPEGNETLNETQPPEEPEL
ncbi:MAG: helix-turn-helix domain-containing protein, partial [Candidatus Aenigmarchaeota archaeon]